VLAQLEELHPEDLRVVFRHFPLLSIHDKASLAGQAAEAAGAQGAFWSMHDLLFERFAEWASLSETDFQKWLFDIVEGLEIDGAKFEEDIQNGIYAQSMLDAFNNGIAAGIPGTPFIFFNNQLFRFEPSLTNLEALIRLELLAERQYEVYPPNVIDDTAQYIATIELNSGELVIQLYPQAAPLAVNSFIFLAQEGWFDGLGFHRVVPGVLVESGDPSATGLGGPGYHFPNELTDDLNFDEAGMVALTSMGPDTNASQFFITLSPQPELNNTRTIFGRVIKGLELLQELPEHNPLENLFDKPEFFIVRLVIGTQ
jgi:cyclophilin family peptidyl-prolyl cis-trans isomerase